PVVIREAILRERDRGGQIFYVAPRISDLDEVRQELRNLVPEIRVGMAHGRMPASELEDVMTAFDERAFDVLLSTNIIESDLDIRGAGNLLGDEQSGHIREVGIELYQHMLEEAVAAARSAGGDETAAEEWTPQITIGMPVLIPETYVADLGVRLGLYRRIAQLSSRRERDAFAAELIDRFGPLPPEVENLLQIIAIKRDCREAGVERVEAGPKGAVITLRGNRFANPQGLVELIQKNAGTLRLRPDQRLVYLRNWDDEKERLAGVARLMQALVKRARA